MLLFPSIVFADGIENYYINATVLDNGDLEVQEYFNLTGTYNGMEREINFRNSNAHVFNPDMDSYGGSTLHNGSSITIEEIRAVDVDDNFNFKDINGDVFKSVYNASKGDYGVYTSSKTYDGISVRMFLPSYKNKAFYIKYILKDMAILHNDVGELGWNVIGDSLLEDIAIKIFIVLVERSISNGCRLWSFNGKYAS